MYMLYWLTERLMLHFDRCYITHLNADIAFLCALIILITECCSLSCTCYIGSLKDWCCILIGVILLTWMLMCILCVHVILTDKNADIAFLCALMILITECCSLSCTYYIGSLENWCCIWGNKCFFFTPLNADVHFRCTCKMTSKNADIAFLCALTILINECCSSSCICDIDSLENWCHILYYRCFLTHLNADVHFIEYL